MAFALYAPGDERWRVGGSSSHRFEIEFANWRVGGEDHTEIANMGVERGKRKEKRGVNF